MIGLTVFGGEEDEAALFEHLSPRFGVVPTIRRDPVSATNAGGCIGSRCISVGHRSPISARELRALKDAGVAHLSSRSIGVDHIDVDAADRLGIVVEGVGYAPDGVADFTVMLLLMALRDAKTLVLAGKRGDLRLPAVRGRDLRDLTVGVVGAGSIGMAVLRRLQGFGCRMLVSSLGRPAVEPAELVSLDALLRGSDIVTLHVPLTTATRHLLGREQLAAMRRGALLVNTSRGALVDTDALVAALECGALGGAALDVLEGEEALFHVDGPDRPADERLLRLLAMPNVIVTPHTAYFTARTLHETVERTLVSCVTFEGNRTSGQTEDRDLVRGLFGGT